MSKPEESEIILYQSDDGKIKFDVRIEGETVWLTIDQMTKLFNKSRATINEHILHIFKEGELRREECIRKIGISDFSTKPTNLYNLDVIISVGYRVKSIQGTRFRQWATTRIREYIIKGFTLDDERLKQNGGRYFKELLQRIRDIRSSERNLWQQVCDIYATSIDYNKDIKETRNFYATVQNKMIFAVTGMTAAEIVYSRADSEKTMVGMTNFKNDYITKSDITISKNYLNEDELQKLNLLVSRFLDYAELQAMEHRTMTMKDWREALDNELKNARQAVLLDNGQISHKIALDKASQEYDKYRQKEFENYESDYDRTILELTKKAKQMKKGDK